MTQTILVISDLHLGGRQGFQMCSQPGRARLAEFVKWAKEVPGDVTLVLNVDIVDFLAEPDRTGGYNAFTSQDDAVAKLTLILRDTEVFFDELNRFVAAGKRLMM